MAVKIKDLAKSNKAHVARFNFTSEESTGTIAELIQELNIESRKMDDEEIIFDSLAGTLGFIEQVTGQRIVGQHKTLPLSTLKVIKFLYIENEESERHLFRLLSAPGKTSKPTMEFNTHASPNGDLLGSIAHALSLEIPKEKLALLTELTGDPVRIFSSAKFQQRMQLGDDEIEQTFKRRMDAHDYRMANAYYALSKYIESIDFPNTTSSVPTNEAIFVHIATLELQHFIVHHRSHLKKVRLEKEIGNISEELANLCLSISERMGLAPLSPFHKQFSVDDFYRVVFGFEKEFESVVRAATGFETRKRRMRENTVRARALLKSYAYRSFDEIDPAAPVISLVDIVAALCSFRIQQEIKADYSPYWHGQKSQGNDPQRLFDKTLKMRETRQHQGVFQLYYYRFEEYQAAFSGTSKSYYALLAFRLARLDSYLRIVRLKGIVGIFTALTTLEYVCLEKATDIVIKYPNSGV